MKWPWTTPVCEVQQSDPASDRWYPVIWVRNGDIKIGCTEVLLNQLPYSGYLLVEYPIRATPFETQDEAYKWIFEHEDEVTTRIDMNSRLDLELLAAKIRFEVV